jgi:hypothetical protein
VHPPFRTICVLYPRGSRTGGPEALHQLVDALRSLGQDAYLTPLPGTREQPRVAEYAHYDAPELPEPVDASDCAVVASETGVVALAGVTEAARVCWWLSVDNSPLFVAERMRRHGGRPRGAGALANAARAGRGLLFRGLSRLPQWRGTLHLAQSHYAWHFLHDRLGVTPSLVTDHTPLADLDAMPRTPMAERGPTVAYNPKKGGWVVDELRRAGAPYEFVAIEKMTREEAFRALCASAVYLDMGYHPGKDRMPREAAIAGAVTVVARRGAGANSMDVPLPWEHKVDVSGNEVGHAAARLADVLSAPEDHKARQSSYEDFVRGERQRFVREVAAVFVHGRTGSDLPGDRLPGAWR